MRYQREQKCPTGSGAGRLKSYQFAEQLCFLNSTIKFIPTESNVEDVTSDNDDAQVEEQSVSHEQESDVTSEFDKPASISHDTKGV